MSKAPFDELVLTIDEAGKKDQCMVADPLHSLLGSNSQGQPSIPLPILNWRWPCGIYPSAISN